MTRRAIWLAAVVYLAAGAPANADDTLKKTGGETLRGTIKSMTATEVVLEKAAGEETIGVVEIDRIEFQGEPPQMKFVRSSVANGAYENALKNLDRLEAGTTSSDYAKVDMQFYRALCNARLALGDAQIREAGKQMRKFVEDNPKSYHFLEATQVLGDLFVAVKAYDQARESYTVLANSPFPEYKMRAGVAAGRLLIEQSKFDEASTEFDKVLSLASSAGGSKQVESQRQSAALGKAQCLYQQKKLDEAIQLATQVIDQLEPEEKDLHAQAYLILGSCHKSKGPEGVKPAILAFLHVDVIYYSNPQAHAEALYNLAQLWNDDGKPDRALEASNLLKDRYGNSTWANK